MATVIRTRLSALLPLLQQQVMSVLGFPAERVIILSREQQPYHAQADQYVRIRPRSQMTEDSIVVGAGRFDTRARRKINVTLFTRLSLDEADRDAIWLDDPTLGHLAKEHLLFDAVATWHPLDGAGNWLLAGTAKLGPVSEPSKERAEPEWGKSELDVDLTYVLDLDQTRQ